MSSHGPSKMQTKAKQTLVAFVLCGYAPAAGDSTSEVPVQIKADPGKDALSVQSDILWVQVGDLYLEASLEDLRYSRQVVNFQHLLLI